MQFSDSQDAAPTQCELFTPRLFGPPWICLASLKRTRQVSAGRVARRRNLNVVSPPLLLLCGLVGSANPRDYICTFKEQGGKSACPSHFSMAGIHLFICLLAQDAGQEDLLFLLLLLCVVCKCPGKDTHTRPLWGLAGCLRAVLSEQALTAGM